MEGEWNYKSPSDNPLPLSVKDHNHVRSNLQILDPSEARETLGVELAPDGNNDKAIAEMKKKATDWAEKIRIGLLPKEESWQSIATTITKSLEYKLPALTLTKEQCDSIMNIVLKAGLQSSNISSKFPRAVVYGPKEDNGLEITDLYLQQGASQITILLQFFEDQGEMGHLIRNSLELLKLDIGIGGNIFSHTHSRYEPFLTPCWVTNVWKMINEFKLSVEDKSASPPLRRENDKYIMQEITKTETSKTSLRRINRCRLYLRVITLSDIATGDGKQITNWAKQGNLQKRFKRRLGWPRQSYPSQKSWSAWRKAIKTAFPIIGDELSEPLGAWTDNEKSDWDYFFDPISKSVYWHTPRGKWKVYSRVQKKVV